MLRTSAKIWFGLQSDIKPIVGLPQPESMAEMIVKAGRFTVRASFFWEKRTKIP